jgi:hypothetical protein
MDLPLFVHQQFQNILGQPLSFDLPMDVYDACFFKYQVLSSVSMAFYSLKLPLSFVVGLIVLSRMR